MNDSHATRARIDAAANWYDSRNDFDQHLIKFSWLKMQRRAHGDSVLELGSSDGLMTEELVREFPRVVVLEGSAKNVDSVRRRFPEVEIHHELFENFSTQERFDNVIAARVLEHVDDPVNLLRIARGWLKPGGVLHVVVPNAESLNRKLGFAMGLLGRLDELTERDKNVGHVRVYRSDTLVADIREAGLQVVELTGTFLKPLSNAQMLSWSPELIWGFYKLSDELPQYCTELYAVCTAPEEREVRR